MKEVGISSIAECIIVYCHSDVTRGISNVNPCVEGCAHYRHVYSPGRESGADILSALKEYTA